METDEALREFLTGGAHLSRAFPLHRGSQALWGDACSKGMETDEALREFLTGGARRAGRADEAGPSAADLRELRSLSLSFSLAGAPIGVSLAESDLTDLRCFLQGKSIPSLQVRSCQRSIFCKAAS